MKNRLFVLAAAVSAVCMLLLPAEALAWGQKGHRIVAQIAYDHLSPVARCRINKVLGAREGAVYVANWADELKSDTIYKESGDWHYQDLNPGMTDEEVIATLTNYPAEGGNLFRVKDSLIAELRKDRHSEANLRFIIHFMGDRFCPMHTAHLDDLGGNKVKMKWYGQNTNLHSVWDAKIIDSQGYSYTEYARYLENKYRKERRAIMQLTEEEIVVQNYRLCDSIYAYQETWNGNAYHYVYHWKDSMERQLYVAGIRLAMLLNELY